MKCLGSCGQGRSKCPHPDLCEQSEGVPWFEILPALLWPVALIAVIALVAALWRAFG